MTEALIKTSELSRILVTRTDRIGDLVVSTSFLRALRKSFPYAFIACVVADTNKDLVRGNPHVDRVITYDKKGDQKGWWGNFWFSRQLAREKFDAVIHLHPTNRMHITSWLAGIRKRIGWNNKAAWALTHSLDDIKRKGEKHEAEYNFELLRFLDHPPKRDLQTLVPVSRAAAKSLDELLKHLNIPTDKPWVVLSPGASCPSKRWTPERFGKVADRIHETYQVNFLIIGQESDREYSRRLIAASESGAAIYDLCGRLNLAMLAVLLSRAALLVSNDSGPVHIACAFETPVVSIFGRNLPGLSPKRWGPLGKNSKVIWKDVGCVECLAHNCGINFLCLDVVSVEEVFSAVRTLVPFVKLPAEPLKETVHETY